MVTALYAGSFDPITKGHLDIIRQSSDIFERVIIGVTYNPEKKGFIPVPDRVQLIKIHFEILQNQPSNLHKHILQHLIILLQIL